MSTIQIQIQIIINIVVTFICYEPMLDFSQEESEVIVFDGVDIKVHTYSKARDALDAQRVFI